MSWIDDLIGQTPQGRARETIQEIETKREQDIGTEPIENQIEYYQNKENWDKVYALWNTKLKRDYKAQYPTIDPAYIDVQVDARTERGADIGRAKTGLDYTFGEKAKDIAKKKEVEDKLEDLDKDPTITDEQKEFIKQQYAEARPELVEQIKSAVVGGGHAGIRDIGGFGTSVAKGLAKLDIGEQAEYAKTEQWGQGMDLQKEMAAIQQEMGLYQMDKASLANLEQMNISYGQNQALLNQQQANKQPDWMYWASLLAPIVGTFFGGPVGGAAAGAAVGAGRQAFSPRSVVNLPTTSKSLFGSF